MRIIWKKRLAGFTRAASTSGFISFIALANFAYGQDAASTAATAPVSAAAGPLPQNLTPWGMFLNTDPLVKAVLIGLVVASIVTWTVWVKKTVELLAARRHTRVAFATLASARSLAEAAHLLRDDKGPIGSFLSAAATEQRLSDMTSDGMD